MLYLLKRKASIVQVGDLVKIVETFTSHGAYKSPSPGRIAMIIEGPNEVGKVKLLLSNGNTTWRHTTEVEYVPKTAMEYLKT